VDHLADDLVGTGTSGSLRYAITHAVDGDVITFGVTGTINLNSALPDLTHNISINGPGANVVTVRRDTGGNYRIFTVPSGSTVSISGLTIANGHTDPYGIGGGIYNQGTLTVSNCTVTQNYAGDAGGGGILNHGSLTLSNCTVTQNQSYGDGGSDPSDGGGISNWGTATVNNCTITNNTANGFGGGVANEGAAVTGGTMTIANSTISGNTANGVGEAGFWLIRLRRGNFQRIPS
jgi:hypothetical protein